MLAYAAERAAAGVWAATALEPYFWNLEADVAWKGDLYEALADWNDRAEDLLCIDLTRSTYDWAHLRSHDPGDWLRDEDKHNCLMTAARASTRLLERVAAVAAVPGRRAYLELRFASECARHRRLHGNCTMRELWDSWQRPRRHLRARTPLFRMHRAT